MNLFPIKEGTKWGYIDQKGNIAVAPAFEEAVNFSEGLAAVKIKGKYGFIDEKGKMVIEPAFDFVNEGEGFSEGYAAVGMYFNKSKSKHGWNYIDKKGSLLFQKYFFEARAFSEGWALVDERADALTPRQYTFINAKGEKLTPEHYLNATRFSEGLAGASDPATNLMGFINSQGKWVIKPQFKMALAFSDGVASVLTPQNIVQYIDKNEKVLCTYPIPYLSITDYSCGLIAFPSKENSLIKGYMDKKGKVVIEPKAGLGGQFFEDMAVISQNNYDQLAALFQRGGNYGYINTKGEVVIPPVFFSAENFHNGLARVYPDPQRENDFGYIDKHGKWIWQPTKKFTSEF